MLSGKLIFYFLLATVITYITGLILEDLPSKSGLKGKALTHKKRQVLAAGIALTVEMLVIFKYYKLIGFSFTAPIGISYYTLQTVSYMTDVHRGTIHADRKLSRLALYLSFFPQVIEGPISRYSDFTEELFSGRALTHHNLKYGYQRILWGLFKKMIIADRLVRTVSNVYSNHEVYDGLGIAIGGICFTIQLYMEFSGCMDIILGSGEALGVKLPENFRQPFFAENASDFWRRWHITLGTWLKDYIFYPISLAKPVKKLAKNVKKLLGIQVSKFVAPTIALFFVWLGNGVWHGAGWPYIMYGMYYFVLIFFETILENPIKQFEITHNISHDNIILRIFRRIKLLIIVILGELFFRAGSVRLGISMIISIFTKCNIATFMKSDFGIEDTDICVAIIGTIIVLIVDILHEKGIHIRDRVDRLHTPVRWGIWYGLIISLIIMGAYGSGYTIADMIYASY